MTDVDLSDFIDGVYVASVVPELWPQVLRDFARLAVSKVAALVADLRGTPDLPLYLIRFRPWDGADPRAELAATDQLTDDDVAAKG